MFQTEMELIKARLEAEGGFQDGDMLRRILEDDLKDPRKELMKTGERYYNGAHDILRHDFRKTTIYEDDTAGNPVGRAFVNENNANHHNVHNFHRQHVDQKVAYLSGRPPSVTVEGAASDESLRNYENLVTAVTSDEAFADMLQDLETGASNKGVEWLHVYYDQAGALRYVIVPAEGCIPLYDTPYQKELVGLIRYYELTEIGSDGERPVRHAEWWTGCDVTHYTENEKGEVLLQRRIPHWFHITSIDGREVRREPRGWGRVPFIPLYNNSRAQSDLVQNKGLIDAYNLISSTCTNNQIDLVELYWMISGYGGETAKSIAQKLKINKAVSVSDPGGKIEARQVTLDVSERISWLKMLRRDIYHLGMAVDTDDETFGTAPSGIALKFRYTQLDMKADRMIVKLRRAMKEFFWFLTEDFRRRYGLRFDSGLVRFDVNKSVITNDLETVQIINLSRGLIPDALLLAKHPFVDDVNQAMADMEKQRRKEAEQLSGYRMMGQGDGGDDGSPE